jgi:dihydrolipoamide dehydrogenase
MSWDLLVLGSGSAGWYCARAAARAGFRTALAEKAELGGTGFRWGCLPVKMGLDELRRRAARSTRRPARAARSLAPPSLLAEVAARLPSVEKRLEEGLRAAGVALLRGEAAFVGPHTLSVEGQRVEARVVVIATGSRPAAPSGLALDGERVLGHADLLRLPRAPRSVAVVGGDVEGAELACLLGGMGSEVHLLEQQEEVLPGQDRDLAEPVIAGLESFGVRLRLGSRVVSAAPAGRGVRVQLADGGPLEVDRVLVTGLRAPNLPAGLREAGVQFAPDRIPVDAEFRTSAPHIYAIGDVNGVCAMAHAAIQQGALLPAALRGGRPAPSAYPTLPRALFTIPEIAGAGLQERELDRRGLPYRCGRAALAETWRGLSQALEAQAGGFVKALAAPDGRLLGIWACAPNASELAAPFAGLLDRGAGAEEVLRGLFIHPTLGEGLLEAALRL